MHTVLAIGMNRLKRKIISTIAIDTTTTTSTTSTTSSSSSSPIHTKPTISWSDNSSSIFISLSLTQPILTQPESSSVTHHQFLAGLPHNIYSAGLSTLPIILFMRGSLIMWNEIILNLYICRLEDEKRSENWKFAKRNEKYNNNLKWIVYILLSGYLAMAALSVMPSHTLRIMLLFFRKASIEINV